MKIDKYKDAYSKIDTDESMDKRIKDRLLYYDSNTEYAKQWTTRHSKQRIGLRTFMQQGRRLSILRVSLPSAAFLIFMVIIIISVKAKISGDNSSQMAANSTIAVSDSSDSRSGDDGSSSGFLSMLSDFLKGKSNVTPTEAAVSPSENIDNPEIPSDSQYEAGDFYFASFDVLNKNNVKASIPNLVIRLHGKVDSINADDLTDVVLTRDGIPVENALTLTDNITQFQWQYEDVTDFYFKFEYDNRETGVYGLSGKYKGVGFTVYGTAIEAPITDEPADSDDLMSVGWTYYTDKNENPIAVSEVSFNFNGKQNSFFTSDLTELSLTLDGTEIPYDFNSYVFRYYELISNNQGKTSYNLVFTKQFTQSGTYGFSGKYREVSFTSMKFVIP